MSLHKNFNINDVRRSFRSFSDNDGNGDLDVPNIARPNIVAENKISKSKAVLEEVKYDFDSRFGQSLT